jgi:peptide deformylase
MKLEVRIYGDPVLREKAVPADAGDPALRALADDMIETMRAEAGVGLAAQQVGKAIALCVIEVPAEFDTDKNGVRLNPGLSMPMVVINPEIVSASKKTGVHEEGCLSFPDIRANIDRPRDIRLRYVNERGEPQDLEVRGFVARVIQHEVDHLNGVLFIDRMSMPKRIALAGRLKRMKAETEERLG